MSDVSYTRVNFEDSPSTNTPLSADNLNVMDKGISDCATEINNRQPKTDNNLNTTNKTITGAINEINASLTDFQFAINNGVPQFSVDDGTTWNNLGGNTLKCIGYGIGSGNTTISLSDFNYSPSSTEDYIVLLDSGSINSGYASIGGGCYISAKTTTSFTIKATYDPGSGSYVFPYSYQIIALN